MHRFARILSAGVIGLLDEQTNFPSSAGDGGGRGANGFSENSTNGGGQYKNIFSPLKYKTIFGVFRNVREVYTPAINNKILLPRGLPTVQNSANFLNIYKEGREFIKNKTKIDGVLFDVKEALFPVEKLLEEVREESPSDRSNEAQITKRLDDALSQLADIKEKYVKEKSQNLSLKRQLSINAGDDEIVRKVRGPFPKRWSDLKSKAKRRASANATEELKRIGLQREVNPETVAAEFIYRSAYPKSKKKADLVKKLIDGETDLSVVPLSYATWLITLGEGWGQRQYRKQKAASKQLNIARFPSWPELVSYWDEKIIVPEKFTNDPITQTVNGIFYEPKEFIPKYMKRWLEAQELGGSPVSPGMYSIRFKVGADSGRHNLYSWSSLPTAEGTKTTQALNIFDLTLLSVKSAPGTPDFHWKEKVPNSEKATRVRGILIGEESWETVGVFTLNLQDKEEALCEGFTVKYKGEEFDFIPEFLDRNDKKFSRLLTGVKDGCDSCEVHRDSWVDPEFIKKGSFPMVRSMERLRRQWQELDKDLTGSIIRRTGDYEVRKGICDEPHSHRDLWPFTVTHKYIHFLDQDIKILIHLRMEHLDWNQYKDLEGRLKAEMTIIQEALKPGNGKPGISYNMATSGGTGGNTTTAESARKVYSSPELRERLVKLCPDEHKYMFGQILFYNNLILRLTSCGKPLLVDKIEELCKEQSLRYVNGIGSWVRLPDTIHEELAHLADTLRLNGNFGLKEVSEENLEKLHKIIRRLREKKARLTGVSTNLKDLLRRAQHFRPATQSHQWTHCSRRLQLFPLAALQQRPRRLWKG